MPKAAKQVDKNDPEYLEKRKRNNEAIKKCREKAKAKAEETQRKVETLKKDNKMLDDKISVLGQEMQFLEACSPFSAATSPAPLLSLPPAYPGYQAAATSPAPLLSTPPADTETLPAFLEQGEVEVAKSSPYPGYQPAATWAGPDLNTYTLTEAEAGSVAECEELALVSALLGPLDQDTVTPELPSYQDLAPATTWAGPDLNTYSYTTTSFSTTAEEFDLSFLAPGHQDGLHGYGGYQQRPASQ